MIAGAVREANESTRKDIDAKFAQLRQELQTGLAAQKEAQDRLERGRRERLERANLPTGRDELPFPFMSGALPPSTLPRRGTAGNGNDPDPDPSDDDSHDERRSRRRRSKRSRHHGRRRRRSSPPSSGDDESSDSSRSRRRQDFKPDQIGYFDPYLDIKEFGKDDICEKGGKTYFRSVSLFLDSARDHATMFSATETRRHLNKCLRGTASIWFIHHLTADDRKWIRRGRGIERWDSLLFNRFKIPTSQAWGKLNAESYSFKDAHDRRPVADFVMNCVRWAREADVDKLPAQLVQCWLRLEPEFRNVIPKPSATTSLSSFIEDLESHYESWVDMAPRASRKSYPNQGYADQEPKGRYSQPDNRRNRDDNRGELRFQGRNNHNDANRRAPNNTDPAQGRPRNQESGNQIAYPDRKRIEAPLTTPAPGKPSGYDSRNPSGQPGQPWPNRYKQVDSRTYNNQGRNYHATDSPTGDPENEGPPSHQGSGSNEYSDDGGRNESGESAFNHFNDLISYSDDNYNSEPENNQFDLYNYFADTAPPKLLSPASNRQASSSARPSPSTAMEPATLSPKPTMATCKTCGEDFTSRNELHQHLKAAHPQDQPKLASRPIQQVKPMRVVQSTAIGQDKGGFAFRGFYYLRMPVRLAEDGADHAVCLDTGATVSMIDEEFLRLELPGQARHRLQIPFHVRGVGNHTDLCTHYVLLDFWIPASVKGERVLAHVQHEVHITRNLKPRMLLAMDIIGPELIKIDVPRKLATLGTCEKAKVPLLVKRRDQVRFRTAVRTG